MQKHLYENKLPSSKINEQNIVEVGTGPWMSQVFAMPLKQFKKRELLVGTTSSRFAKEGTEAAIFDDSDDALRATVGLNFADDKKSVQNVNYRRYSCTPNIHDSLCEILSIPGCFYSAQQAELQPSDILYTRSKIICNSLITAGPSFPKTSIMHGVQFRVEFLHSYYSVNWRGEIFISSPNVSLSESFVARESIANTLTS